MNGMMQLHIQKVASLLLLFFMLLLVCLQPAAIGAPQAAALRVLAIEIDGKTADRAEGVVLTVSGESAPRKTALKTGDALAQGTDIVVPPRTVLVLETTNGNQIRLQPGCGYRTGSVSGRGETHTMLFGKAFFRVKHALDFFNVNYESFLAIVRGTEFSVEVEPKKEISFSLDKGRLLVQRDVKVRILEGDKVAELKASEVLQQGGKTTVSYRLGIDEYLQEFKTFRDAEEYYRCKLEEDERSGDYDRIQGGLNAMGNILCRLGKDRDAIGYYERALQSALDHRDETGEATLNNNMGVAYQGLGEYSKAIKFYEKDLSIILKLYPNGNHPDIAASYNNLGSTYNLLGEYSKAIEFFEKSLKITSKLYANGIHPDIAVSYNNLGSAYNRLSEFRKAIDFYENALAIMLKLYPNGIHPDIAVSYNNLGTAFNRLGEFRKAIEFHEKALAMALKLYPKGIHPDIALSYINLGNAYDALGEYRKAIEINEKALVMNLKLYPVGVHPDIALSYINLGNAYYGLGEYRKAVEFFGNALEMRLKLYPNGIHPYIASNYNNLGIAYFYLGEYPKAIEFYEKSLGMKLKLYPKGIHPDIALSYKILSLAYGIFGEPARANEYAKKALDIENRLKGK
jgi:tetratricopeptide (TPR) repeat protein